MATIVNGHESKWIYGGPNTKYVAVASGQECEWGEVLANAERIVACVNACEGMADPEATITALRRGADVCEAFKAGWDAYDIGDGSDRNRQAAFVEWKGRVTP